MDREESLKSLYRYLEQLITGETSVITKARAEVLVCVGAQEVVGYSNIYVSDLWGLARPFDELQSPR
jgi:hypothetical protein